MTGAPFDLGPYRFRPAVEADHPLLRRWLGTPEVARWWGDPDEEAELLRGDLDDPRMAMWIVEHAGRPFAYIQDYDTRAWPQHHFAGLPPGSRGIDQFIGEPDMLNRGHGSAFIGAFAGRLLAKGAPAIGTDPDPENLRARRAYEKAGFTGDAVHRTEWGPAVLMVRRAAG
ncbi:MAG TPA: GNAT family N-acetyltransferase [Alphaproteobacteria bacterium]|nr:GNAT family N-acetyltransferase [Alphaproteobacteria bacterium]